MLDDVSLRVEEGSFCALLGPSGCGKTSTLRLIAGLDPVLTGRIAIGDQDVTAQPPAQRQVSMVFQNYALFPHLTVAENIVFGLRIRGVDGAERVRLLQEAADTLGLNGLLERRPAQLSGGQQQRVALGRALVSRARVCLMDEPLSNLDAQLRQAMRVELRELQQKLGLTLIYVTHDQAEAMSMADQVVLMNAGRVEQAGPPAELYDCPATPFAARFIGSPPMNLLQLVDGTVVGTTQHLCGMTPYEQVGVRPEAVRLGDSLDALLLRGCEVVLPASVLGTEYLGADQLLHCTVGTQTLVVRLDGRQPVHKGAAWVGWLCEDMHVYDSARRRVQQPWVTEEARPELTEATA